MAGPINHSTRLEINSYLFYHSTVTVIVSVAVTIMNHIIIYSYHIVIYNKLGKMRKQTYPGLLTFLSLTALFLHLCCFPALGLDPAAKCGEYLLKSWDSTAGIPSNTILSLAQTGDGYLWIASQNGLVRFDGRKFTTLPFIQESRLSHRQSTLHVDMEGRLHIGSEDGLVTYDYRTGRFKSLTNARGFPGGPVRHILEDMKGNLWISTSSNYVTRLAGGIFTTFDDSHGLEGKKVNTIVEDRKGDLFFGTREKGMFHFKSGKFFKYTVPGIPLGEGVFRMCEDRDGDLWIGTANGLFRKNHRGARKYSMKDGLYSNYIIDIMEDDDGNLWLGTEEGLNRLQKKKDGTGAVDIGGILHSKCITRLFNDREGNFWAGTIDEGLFQLKDRTFQPFPPLSPYREETFSAMYEDRWGHTWFGAVSGKLFRYKEGALEEMLKPARPLGAGIVSIAADERGNLWLGTNDKGVFKKIPGQKQLLRFTTADGLVDNTVISIFRDSRDNLWFSTFSGVSLLRPGAKKFGTLEAGKEIHNVYEDRNGNIRIAGGQGITLLKGGDPSAAPVTYLAGVSVTCLYEAVRAHNKSGENSGGGGGTVFWAATHGNGFKRLELKEGKTAVTSYTTAQGMASNFIYQFFEDRQENFWLMSNSGVLRVSKPGLERIARGEAGTVNCRVFGIPEGMESPEFYNRFSRHAAIQTGGGALWFVTRKGISTVHPATVRINKSAPPVAIEKIFFDRDAVSLSEGTVALSPKGLKEASFHFTAPTFLAPEKTSFKYRLHGLKPDPGWTTVHPGTERMAYYRDLAPGSYTFHVTASNGEGIWNRTGAGAAFTVIPLWHQTLFAKIVGLFLLAAVIAVIVLLKRRPFRRKKRIDEGAHHLHPIHADECLTKLKRMMEEEKIYHETGISLKSLADRLSITSHQLSRLLNERLEHNFNDYINVFRIEEVKQILSGPRGNEKKISSLSYEVGFNTTAAFYKVFKKYTGQTPGQFRKDREK